MSQIFHVWLIPEEPHEAAWELWELSRKTDSVRPSKRKVVDHVKLYSVKSAGQQFGLGVSTVRSILKADSFPCNLCERKCAYKVNYSDNCSRCTKLNIWSNLRSTWRRRLFLAQFVGASVLTKSNWSDKSRSSKMFVCPQPANFGPKCPPQKARNRDKAELATKVRNKYRLC